MARILHHYRPHLDQPQDLEAISVAREPLLQEVLSRLQHWEYGASRQHYLLIGPRGIGKTHVLRLLQHRMDRVAARERKWFTLLFPEEQYAVTSVPDLLIETLRLLSEASGDRAITERHARLKREGDDRTLVDLALDALRSFCRARKCGVLLMLENVDRLLEDQIKKDEQIALLRRILIEEDWPVLVATSPTYLSDVTDPEKPFFEFFQIENLDELSPEDVEVLLRKRAQLDHDAAFLAYLDRYRSRLRALYHFSGGNPRLTLMLYDLLSRQAVTDVKIELDGLLNQLTPFYQDRMKEIGAQEAKVLARMAALSEGVTPTELAAECRMDRGVVSALLSRLEKGGYVRREPRAQKQTVYIIPERFFRIWHQMTSSRLARGRIQYLLDFFSTWYATPEERDEIWDCLITQFQGVAEGDDDGRTEDVSAYMDYIAAVSEGTEQFQRHFDRLRQHAKSGDIDRVRQELAGLDVEFAADADYFVYKGEFLGGELGLDREALEAFHRALDLNRDHLEALFNQAVALDKLGRTRAAKRAYGHAVELLSTQRGGKVAKDTTQFLLHVLENEPDRRLTRIAAFLLGRTAGPPVLTQLVHALRLADTHWRRRFCATALGLLGSLDAVPILIESLRDDASDVRGSAATALGKIGASEAVPVLIEALRDDASDVRGSAATALGKIGASEAVSVLVEALHDEAQDVRGSAATALGKIRASEAVPALIEALHDEAQDVRGSAATALGKIRASEAVPALIEALHDEVSGVRGSAATALGRIGTTEAVAAVVDAIPDLVDVLQTQAEDTRIRGAGFFLRAAFRSGNLSVVQAFVEGFVSQLEEGEQAFLPYRVALEFLRKTRAPTVLYRQPPEVREAVDLLVSLFDQARES